MTPGQEPLDDLHITGRVARERDQFRAERDQARERYADAVIANRELASELAAARNVVNEILGKFKPTDPSEPHGRYAAIETAAMVEHWRKRAGLDAP